MTRKITPERKNLKYFFWDGHLYKIIRINRPANLVEAWCFSERKSVTMLYSDYKNRAKPAIQSGAAAKIMRVDIRTIKMYVWNGFIHPVEVSYALDGLFGESKSNTWNESKVKWWWGEHNLMELHDYLMTTRRGFPRKDGGPTPLQHTPSKAEIRAAFNNSTVLYVKGASGEFIPTFEQPKW